MTDSALKQSVKSVQSSRPKWMSQHWATLKIWQMRFSTRAQLRMQLRDVDSRIADDIGVDVLELHEEARKPFWRT